MPDDQDYKHLIIYPKDLKPVSLAMFKAVGRDVDEIKLDDCILPKDWRQYEVIMFIDDIKEHDKILWDKELDNQKSKL